MIPMYYLIILAIVQGITEFLPISSSAHLVILPYAMGEADQGLLIDVAGHVGTLFAVMLYFHKDILSIANAFTLKLTDKSDDYSFYRKLGILVILASLPVILAGFALHSFLPEGIRDIRIIAATTLIFGLMLWWADRRAQNLDLKKITFKSALIIGFAQIFALLPGTSRSGVTMTAAMALGFSRAEAARFSLLLGIPAILGAGTLGAIDLIKQGDNLLQIDALIAAALSFITAYVSILVMMRWLKSSTFTPFVIYRMILGIVLLFIITMMPT